jgi:hypothetical protein
MKTLFVKSVVSDGQRFKSGVLGSGFVGMIGFVDSLLEGDGFELPKHPKP